MSQNLAHASQLLAKWHRLTNYVAAASLYLIKILSLARTGNLTYRLVATRV
ncbi:MAG: hypothetical protein H7230_00180 [Candidatus Parcubacteria bacterium]|nr:hypothetical protein [Candidatus Paceibacterota bacterium]